APVADFRASPTTGTAPLSVAFTDLSTGTITAQSWSFGDGSTSAAQNPTHVYAAAGSFTVSLTVTGPGGADTKTAPNSITVNAPPVLVVQRPAPGLAGRLNPVTATGVAPDAAVYLLGSTAQGASLVRTGGCAVATGLANPKIIAKSKAVGTTATFSFFADP